MEPDRPGSAGIGPAPQRTGIANAMCLDSQALDLARDFAKEGTVARNVRCNEQQRTGAREPGRPRHARHRPESYRPARRPSLGAIRRWHGERADKNTDGVRRARWRETPSLWRDPAARSLADDSDASAFPLSLLKVLLRHRERRGDRLRAAPGSRPRASRYRRRRAPWLRSWLAAVPPP